METSASVETRSNVKLKSQPKTLERSVPKKKYSPASPAAMDSTRTANAAPERLAKRRTLDGRKTLRATATTSRIPSPASTYMKYAELRRTVDADTVAVSATAGGPKATNHQNAGMLWPATRTAT